MRRKMFGLTMQALADYVGVSQPTVSQWESDLTLPKGQNMRRLEEILRTNSDWLTWGEGDPDARYVLVRPSTDEFKVIDSFSRQLPVITIAQALTWCDLSPDEQNKAASKSNIVSIATSKGGFILIMPNDSMVGPNNPRSLQAGCQLVVEPEFKPNELNEKVVVVAVEDAPVAMVREFIQDGPLVFLRSFNPSYPILNAVNFRVIGVVKQAVVNL
ncbi:transcriptional regulator, XRE family [Tolumonas auensis DSM 9187]|uniref:Transcriptional regulator, XRE family n=1 Tax=Tolumonas auensis (strain DSM 9187 / NBRC 110442 / TA 4) TaxID=595494 RepID=C4LFU1_TOLAT|nr:helix-turn-helix domain-containing protein [Tolumonas auensis]ACQ93458.1 transcriptional regulator, XRE family [Tolumonas auensis DSM 9187]